MSEFSKTKKGVEDVDLKKKGVEDEDLEGNEVVVSKAENSVAVDGLSLGDKVNDMSGTVSFLSVNQPVFNIFGPVRDSSSLGNNEVSRVKDVEAKKLEQPLLKDGDLEGTDEKNWIGKRVTIGESKTGQIVRATVIEAFQDKDGKSMWTLDIDDANGKKHVMNESELETAIRMNDNGETLFTHIFATSRVPGDKRKHNRSKRTRKSGKRIKYHK